MSKEHMAPILLNKEGVKIFIHSRDHLPPHIHVQYADDEAIVSIRTGEILKGHLPSRKLLVVQTWLNEGDVKWRVEEIFYELNAHIKLSK
jgi:hypothetical protein